VFYLSGEINLIKKLGLIDIKEVLYDLSNRRRIDDSMPGAGLLEDSGFYIILCALYRN